MKTTRQKNGINFFIIAVLTAISAPSIFATTNANTNIKMQLHSVIVHTSIEQSGIETLRVVSNKCFNSFADFGHLLLCLHRPQ